MRPHNDGIAIYGDRVTEYITAVSIAGGQYSLLGPDGPVPLEDIGRTGIAAIVVILMRPHNDGIAIYGDRVTKQITAVSIAGGQFGLLGPDGPVPLEDIGRTGTAATVVIPMRPHNDGIAIYGDRVTEYIRGITVASC